ncbi:cyanophycinase [Bdellovibrio sp. 22V]|uniref:cyanophycinase n=1 Tax=Bdellovibrio TaxID=958 RepID=UPI0025427EA0|nr:cyanophycinase [Bdellovibrio sp. 22V]WII70735.1 cyanophycinase [Bdellovibrio sp. 22V]
MASGKKVNHKRSRVKAKRTKVTHKGGTLIIIGGREDKTGEMRILKEVASRTDGGKMVIVTAASEVAEEVWNDYYNIFRKLGVKQIEHFYVNQPEDTLDKEHLFRGATTVFFTGGDQLKVTTKLGGTLVIDWMVEIFKNGGTLAGTSAGASIMGEVMLVGGENTESHKVGNWMMAPGLRFVENMIIDQHFAQRGRIGRLLGAVALNPGILGIGIDEGTAIIVEKDHFEIIGENAVYVIDGRGVTYTNISEASAEKTMSMHDIRLHVLADTEVFDLKLRRAIVPKPVDNSLKENPRPIDGD